MKKLLVLAYLTVSFALTSCSTTDQLICDKNMGVTYQRVVASYYANSLAGHKTASGEKYDPSAMSAAHKSLPFGSMIEVRNPKNSKKVLVKVDDRGPHVKGRQLDLSKAAARQLGISGVQSVEMRVVSP